MKYEATQEFARDADAKDSLRSMRDAFHIPTMPDGRSQVYLVGNSLGLQPKRTRDYLLRELSQWEKYAVEGHFEGEFPWMPYHEFLTPSMAEVVGAMPEEVVVMNSLTTNLHLMLATFFRPEGKRRRILLERGAFPSDHFAIESHLRHRAVDPREGMLLVGAGDGEILSTQAITDTIRQHHDELALVLLPGVQYYTGQFLDLKAITDAAHELGIIVGFDLAHAAGNVPLELHAWDVDFAVWCTYKYLNSGPGSLGGCYIHQRHATKPDLPRLAGWWGQEKSTRFEMRNEFHAIPTAEGWQLSNPAILSMAAVRASLDLFVEVGGMEPLRKKSLELTGYFEFLIRHAMADHVRIVTPKEASRRGCQLSLELFDRTHGRTIVDRLAEAGCVADWREPNVLRCAPVPMYNTFEDVYRFVAALSECLNRSNG